jgi:hypothetical protein
MKKLKCKLRAIRLILKSKGFYVGVVDKKDQPWSITDGLSVADAKIFMTDVANHIDDANQQHANLEELNRLIKS